jgi:hypothetical protein
LTVFTPATVDRTIEALLRVPKFLADNAAPNAGHCLASRGWNFITTIFTLSETGAGRHLTARKFYRICNARIDLILNGAVLRPTTRHWFLLSEADAIVARKSE